MSEMFLSSFRRSTRRLHSSIPLLVREGDDLPENDSPVVYYRPETPRIRAPTPREIETIIFESTLVNTPKHPSKETQIEAIRT